MKFFDVSWKPGQRWKVYGGTLHPKCRVYTRDTDDDMVGQPTTLVGPHDELDAYCRGMNQLVGYIGPHDPEVGVP